MHIPPNAQDLAAVKRGLEAFKMDGGEMDEVWRVVSAVMLLGNVLFKAGTKPGSDAEIAQIADEATIVRAAAALGCEVASTYYLLLTADYCSLTTHYSLLTAHCSLLLTTHCSLLLTTHYSLLTTHCSLLTAHYSLLTAHCSLLTAH